MQILVDRYHANQYPREFFCRQCDSQLGYDDNDLKYGAYGCAYIKCPLCGCSNILDDEEPLKLTIDNVNFPTHFDHFSEKAGALSIPEETINQCIRKGIKYLRENKDEDFWLYRAGDTCVFIFKFDEEDRKYNVVVSKDYHETNIGFEKIDY